MNKIIKNKARYLTLLLRHKPENLNIEYNGGWCNIESIFKKLEITISELEMIVKNDNKNRFSSEQKKVSETSQFMVGRRY